LPVHLPTLLTDVENMDLIHRVVKESLICSVVLRLRVNKKNSHVQRIWLFGS
jgi:hypothetical protein